MRSSAHPSLYLGNCKEKLLEVPIEKYIYSEMEDLAEEHVEHARQLLENGNYSKAFDVFIKAFDKCPGIKPRYEPEFRALLLKLNDLLGVSNMDIIFKNFERAIGEFPNNMYLYNDIGKYLYKLGFYTEAWGHFQKALKQNPGFVNAEKNLNSMKNLLVERWHYRMLNDKVRNEAYYNALSESIIPFSDNVIDVGTGTGILSMYANDFTPLRIVAVEASETMVLLAFKITEANRAASVSIVKCMSTQLDASFIGGKRSLLVTEMFDAGLFGEHILQTMSHAWQHLMVDTGRMIPNKAEFFVMGAECESLGKKYKLCSSIKATLNIPELNVHIATRNETYDCEDVHFYKDIKYLTEPVSLLEVDFNSHNDIKEKMARVEPYDADFKVTQDGQINLVIGWFKLYLYKDFTLTTDPRAEGRANAWQQAVFFDNIPKKVEVNDVVQAKFLLNGGKLAMCPDNNISITRISVETLRFLNDSEYLKRINGCIGMACVYLGQMTDMSQTTIVDLCPFPMFGLQMLKRGAESLTCYAKRAHDKEFLETVFKANNIPLSKVTILEGDKFTQKVFRDEKYSAIFVHMFDKCGEIDLRIKELAHHLKHSHLKHGGLFMPANIKLIGQIVSSRWLDINNRIYDPNIGRFKVEKFINEYQVSQNYCLDFSLLEYSPISDPIDLGTCHSEMSAEVVNVPVIKDDAACAIICWYSIELLEDLEEISTNRSMCFMDGIAFLANPPVPMVCDKMANVLRCVDPDGSFKLMLDVDA